MKTPIVDFVRKYTDSGCVRAHMPGHKGTGKLGCERLDITEVSGADVLYHSRGIIRESEQNASRLFGTEKTLYSCEGSSLSVRAMLYLALVHARAEGKTPRILAARNAHKAFLCGCAMLGIDIEWLYSDGCGILSSAVTPDSLREYLREAADRACAVYVTTPDYLGCETDVRGLGSVCREYGVLLLVDSAHGAYLNFLPESRHPIALGADMCCDSAHKTLPVLTGGGYLHISHTAPAICRDSAESAMALFASTSPSYLILQSLDLANLYMSHGYREALARVCAMIAALKEKMTAAGYVIVGSEELKITIDAKAYGYTGDELADIFRGGGIECEFSDPDYVVLMLTERNSDEDIRLIERAVLSTPKRTPVAAPAPSVPAARAIMTPREAMLSPSCEIPVREAVGRVLAQPSVSCPPAIPLLVCGEVIDREALAAFEYYGIDRCRVVLDPTGGIEK